MSGVAVPASWPMQRCWSAALADYITAIAWSPCQTQLAASSAAGEVVLQHPETQHLIWLQGCTGNSVDCLAFSYDGQFLAAGGQAGQVQIWRVAARPELIATLEHAPIWVDRLAWSPSCNQLAFSLGKSVQVWDGDRGAVAATLNFERSSVFNLVWHPTGDRLTVSGYQGVKIWTATAWEDAPYLLTLPSASVAIAWSPDGNYIASGNLDRTITVLEWDNPHPWVMRGFPGKIRQLAWSDSFAQSPAPLLATASAESLVIWEKHPDAAIGWAGRLLGNHDAAIQSVRFQPRSRLLASAAADGWVALWQNAAHLSQTLEGAAAGFTCLAWHSQGQWLAAGGRQGELLIWGQNPSETGFKCLDQQ